VMRDWRRVTRAKLTWHSPRRAPLQGAISTYHVTCDQQDTALWSQSMIDEAEKHLRSAAAFKHMGRDQLEAAIQSVHANRAKTGPIDWEEIALLYEGLVRLAPAIGLLVGRAVAIAQAGKPAA
jgi:predicted RNA polymerase sigma factor